jgi:hypothetical protein
MKHTIKLSNYVTLALLTIATLLTTVATGQKYRYARSYQPSSNKYLVGLEAGMGTSSLNFKSDIADLNNLKFYSTGWNMGLTAGNKAVKFRATFGNYSFQKSLSQKIDQKLLSVKFNASPVRLFSKLKYFQMYALTGVDYGTFSFTGMAVPKYVDPVVIAPPPTQVCCCETNGPPADPGAPTGSEDTESEKLVDSENLSLKKAQINAGLGAEFSMTKRGKYFRMFAEAHYGIPFKEIINDLSLNNTKLSSQLMINIGVGFGITR